MSHTCKSNIITTISKPFCHNARLSTEEYDYGKTTASFLQLRYYMIKVDYQLMEQVMRKELFALHHTEQFGQLTDREVEILQLLACGLNNPVIAKKLHISRYTVETHRKRLKRKLNVKSHLILMKYALAFGLIGY